MGVYVGDSLVAGNVGEVYTKAQVDTMIANAVALAEPVGSIKPFAGTTVPDGYLLCDGSAISRTTYAALFAVIGTTYGAGDGSTTFNIPNYTGGRIITSDSVGVKGNGKGIGLQGGTFDGTAPYWNMRYNEYGLTWASGTGDNMVRFAQSTSHSGLVAVTSGLKTLSLYIKY